jgi:hypothetical protein
MEAPTPSAAALRVRRHRERCRAGVRCVTIELRATEIGALIRKAFSRRMGATTFEP